MLGHLETELAQQQGETVCLSFGAADVRIMRFATGERWCRDFDHGARFDCAKRP